MAGEPSFPISPKGSKAPKSSDLRGHAKLKCLQASEDPVFPGNGKSKTLPLQKMYLIYFTTPGTNEEDCPQKWRARQGIQCSIFQHKIEDI